MHSLRLQTSVIPLCCCFHC